MLRLDQMTIEQLRDEVTYWRENLACLTKAALRDYDVALKAGDDAATYALCGFQGLLSERSGLLNAALNGSYFQTCEACSADIRPGQYVVYYQDVGEVHADCAGAVPDQLREGGRIPLSADELHLEDGEPAPADPHLTVTVSDLLFDEEAIEAIAQRAAATVRREHDRHAEPQTEDA